MRPTVVVELMIESVVEPITTLVALFVAQSQPKPNHDNFCVVYGYSIIKNLYIFAGGSVPMDSDSLADMLSLEDATHIINNLQGLQHLDSLHSNFEIVSNSLTSKKSRFAKELKLTSKWTNIFDERDDSNTDKDDKSVQTTRKLSKSRLKKVNTKATKLRTSKK